MRSLTHISLSPLVLVFALSACTSPPPAQEPRPEAVAAAPAPEPLPPGPAFTEEQKLQLTQLGAVCASAYHLDDKGAVDQVGCNLGDPNGKPMGEPNATPAAADGEKFKPLAKSWHGHFSAPTSEDVVLWPRDSPMLMATNVDGKWLYNRLPNDRVGDADCLILPRAGDLDLLVCKGGFRSLRTPRDPVAKHIRLELRNADRTSIQGPNLTLFSASRDESPWSWLCTRRAPSTSYRLDSLSVTKNATTGEDELAMQITRSGWQTAAAAAAALKSKDGVAACKVVDVGGTEGLPPAPSTVLTVHVTRDKNWLSPASDMAKLEAEMKKEDDAIGTWKSHQRFAN